MSKLDYQEQNLPGSVDAYIRKRLGWPQALKEVLLRELDVSKGTKTAYLPTGMHAESIQNFEWGGVTSREKSIEWLVEKMRMYLAEERNNVVILSHALASREDPFIRRTKLSVVFHEDVIRDSHQFWFDKFRKYLYFGMYAEISKNSSNRIWPSYYAAR